MNSSPVSQPGSPVFNTADELLGPPDGEITAFEEVDSNTPGFVTVGFDGPFADVLGNDITIYLFDWFLSESIEQFTLFASANGTDFLEVGPSGLPTGIAGQPVTIDFDLGASGLSSAEFLRIVNSTVHPLEGEGPDIDAIEVRAIPNPPTLVILGFGLAALGFTARRRKKA